MANNSAKSSRKDTRETGKNEQKSERNTAVLGNNAHFSYINLHESSKPSCSKPFTTLLKQQISNVVPGRNFTGNAHCFLTAIHISLDVVVCIVCITNAFRIFPICSSVTEICHSFGAVPWPCVQKVGHVIARDHWTCDIRIGDYCDLLLVAFEIFQISPSVMKLLLQNVFYANFAWDFPTKMESWLQPYTLDNNEFDIWVCFSESWTYFKYWSEFIISQLLTRSTP